MGTLKEMEKEIEHGVDEGEYEDVTPDWWPEGFTLEVKSETDYEYDPLWSGCDGEWTEKPSGVFGDRKTGRLIDGDVNVAAALLDVTGVEPVTSAGDVWNDIAYNKRVAYALNVGSGELTRISGGGDVEDVIHSFTPISGLVNTIDDIWGYGYYWGCRYYVFPIEASGKLQAIRKAEAMYKKLVKFDEQYCGDGKILSEDGPTKWERDMYKYWQAPDDLDGDSEEDVKLILQLWKHIEAYYSNEWSHMCTYVRVTTPDGDEFEESMDAGDVYWGKKGRPDLIAAAIEAMRIMQKDIPFPMWDKELT